MTERRGLDRFVRACAAVRGRLTATAIAGSFAIVTFTILALSALPPSLREGRGSLTPLLTAVGVLVALAVAVVLTGRGRGRLQPGLLGNEADAAVGLGAGDLRGAIELQPEHGGSSNALARLHVRRVAGRLDGMSTDELLPQTGRLWARRLRVTISTAGFACVVLAVSALVRPEPTLSAARSLSTPWRTAFPTALPPLSLLVVGPVSRGDAAQVEISAPGRSRVVLLWRPAGEPTERRDFTLDTAGGASGSTALILSPTRVWIEDAAGRSSDTALVRPLDPLLVQDLQVRVEYPAYLGRGSETHRGQIPPLVIPEGTRLFVSGEANLPLDAGWLRWSPGEGQVLEEGRVPEEAPRVPLALDGARFGVTLMPKRSGAWIWSLQAADAVDDPLLPDPLLVIVVRDVAPSVQLLYPAPDTILGSGRVMPIIVEVEDDIGLRAVILRSWQSGLGERRAERSEALTPRPDGARRAVFRHLIDRSEALLLPGDTLFYRFEAFDGHPTRGPGISDVFMLRIPTFTEIVDARAAEIGDLADAAAELQEAVDRLAAAAADAARRGEAGEEEGEASFEATEEARAVLENAERANEGLSELESETEALRRELAESPLGDEELARQLELLAERYQELVRDGLDRRIEELTEALENLDPEAVREALEQLSADSDWLRAQLEQTLGLIERAALDQDMKSAQANAEDLAEAERALAESEGRDPDDWADEQQRLADQAERLSDALDDLEARLDESGQEAAADSAEVARKRTDEATQSMEAAVGASSRAGEQGSPEQSRQAASEAADAMEQAARALGTARQDLERGGQAAASESLGRARAEALSLAEEEGLLAEATRGEVLRDPEAWRARQAAVRQGLENMLDRLSESGSEAAMLDQQTGAVAGEVIQRMDRLLERLAEDGARRLPSRAEAERVHDALNDLAMRLLASERAARAAQEQAQGGDAVEQLASLARQQGAITQETSSLLVPGPKPSGQERTRDVTARQEEVAEQLRDLQDPEGELLGRTEELAREAEELARQLAESGPTQETLERQRRLFQRMLDAGRSLEDEDLDPNRRESRTGAARSRSSPEIDPDVLRGRRFPLPSDALLRDLPIFYRPLIFEYFDRLNRPRGNAGRSGTSGR